MIDKVERDMIVAERALHEPDFLRLIARHRATLHDEVETYLRRLSTDLVLDAVTDDRYPVVKIAWHHKGGRLPQETIVTVDI